MNTTTQAQLPVVHACTITCGRCGGVAADHLYYVDGLGQELPQAQFRCPACGHHWERIRNPLDGKWDPVALDYGKPILCRPVVQMLL